jgi:hypothetical protein
MLGGSANPIFRPRASVSILALDRKDMGRGSSARAQFIFCAIFSGFQFSGFFMGLLCRFFWFSVVRLLGCFFDFFFKISN